MAHFDADAEQSLHEPISFRVNGKDYKVVPVTGKVLKRLESVEQEAKQSGHSLEGHEVLSRQLAIFVGAEDPKEFDDLPLNVLAAVFKHVSKAIKDPLERLGDGPSGLATSGEPSQASA